MTSGLQSFGRATRPAAAALPAAEAVAGFTSGRLRKRMLLAYGNGRSYGDSCQSASGTVIDMRGLTGIVAFDPVTGVIEANAGTMLPDIIAHAAPHGYFPAVVPGTQFVTLGGAIANDIHGKNHHRQGTFGRHVESLKLMRSDGRVYLCSPKRNAALFSATVGGMGLTGLILSARVRLMKVASLDVAEQAIPFRNLSDYFDLAEAIDRDNEYAVAWIDQLASGARAGRGVLLAGNHAEEGARQATTPGRRLAVPFQPPLNVLNRPFLTLFNAAYHRAKTRSAARRVTAYQSFFFPLDGVRDWNRLYGPRGLFQHQSAVPLEAARSAIPELLATTREAGQGSFLTVLKRFGDVASPGVLSFPRPGYTLTLDFPNRGTATLALLERLDAITLAAGGAVNPYKDARMSAEAFEASFPRWRELETQRDPAFLSAFWERTAERLVSRQRHVAAAE